MGMGTTVDTRVMEAGTGPAVIDGEGWKSAELVLLVAPAGAAVRWAAWIRSQCNNNNDATDRTGIGARELTELPNWTCDGVVHSLSESTHLSRISGRASVGIADFFGLGFRRREAVGIFFGFG